MAYPNKEAEALDHIVRVALGARVRTNRLNWIIERGKSALNGDSNWRNVPTPRNYHDALERPACPTAISPTTSLNSPSTNS